MKEKIQHPIVFPIDFKVACCIYKQDIAEVLQLFINHVTLFDTVSQTYQEGFTDASHTIIRYLRWKQNRDNQYNCINQCRPVIRANIRQIEILSRAENEDWDIITKRSYAGCFVENIIQAIERQYALSDTIYLDEFSSLKLTRDFCVLCEIYQCQPREYLEYFMGQISLAEAHAREGEQGYVNFIFEFFFKLASGFGRDEALSFDLSDFEIDFYRRMQQIRLEVYVIRDLQQRTDRFRAFYLSHFQAMNRN